MRTVTVSYELPSNTPFQTVREMIEHEAMRAGYDPTSGTSSYADVHVSGRVLSSTPGLSKFAGSYKIAEAVSPK